MKYIRSPSTDPHFNLALEQYVFDDMDRGCGYFLLWQNAGAVIVGKHQNTITEINGPYIKEHHISVVRRLSGGGAVYHDLGNVNFTFIADHLDGNAFDFSTFCVPVIEALNSLGVHAEINGRNDMTIEGKKFSGNSQYIKQGRIMHHGTIMYDSDLDVVEKALTVSKDKIESKGLKSVRSRVVNVQPYMTDQDMPVEQFIEALRRYMFEKNRMEQYNLTLENVRAVTELQKQVYDRWEWNYGVSPAFQLRKERRVEQCGKLELCLDVQNGVIQDIAIYGDYFGSGVTPELKKALLGCPLKEEPLREILKDISIGRHFFNMNTDTFLSILLQ